MANSITDWRGNKIEVGDVILYSVKESTSVTVNEAVVKGFGTQETWQGIKPTIQAEWIRSASAQTWRVVKQVTIHNTGSVTLITKGR